MACDFVACYKVTRLCGRALRLYRPYTCYDNDRSCTEAEYAFFKRKKIIPLKLQEKCILDGPIGIICGTQFYYDFSVPKKFDEAWSKLYEKLKELMPAGGSRDAGLLSVC